MSIDSRKKELRARFRQERAALSQEEKRHWDEAIHVHFRSLSAYQSCETLLCYVTLPGEIDTLPLLKSAWQSGKRVAVPYCVPGTRILEFYIINSLDALREGAFGVREPDPDREKRLTEYDGAICLVPGFSWDREGYRLGYGGGYYDRFLAGPFAGYPSVGACYERFLVGEMIRDGFDVPCGVVLTESGVIKT